MKRISFLAVVLLAALAPVKFLDAEILAPPIDSVAAEWQVMPLGTIRHDKADALYTALAAAHPSVGEITWPGYLASGTLISPTWVLTAAHVVDDATAASEYTFDLTASGGSTYTGKSKMYHPSWTGDLSQGYDIGLLELSSPVAGITPAVLWAGGGELGNVGTHVGYGNTGPLSTGYVSGTAGAKRAGQNMIDVLGTALAYSDRLVLADNDEPGDPLESSFGSSTPLDLEYGIAPGDSGGGLFIGSVLAGVHSFLAYNDGTPNADYGDLSGSVRVSQFQGWITTNASGTTWTPEPSSFLIWSAMTMGLFFVRRRRRGRPGCH